MDFLNLDTLNHDVLFHLFLHSSPKDLSSLLQVNKKFNLIISEDIFWREKAIFDGFLLDSDRSYFPNGLSRSKYLIFYRHRNDRYRTDYITTDAAFGGHKDIVEMMLKKGAIDYGEAMMAAARGGHKDIVERMLDLGATEYDNAMIKAVVGGHKEIKELIQRWKDKKR